MQANTTLCHGNKTYNIGEEIIAIAKNGDVLISKKELKLLEDKGLIANDVQKRLKAEAAKKAKATEAAE